MTKHRQRITRGGFLADLALRDPARMALFRLVRMNYQPSLLGASAAKSKSAAGPRKKISGGCGG